MTFSDTAIPGQSGPIDMTFSDTAIPGQSGPGSDGYKGILRILKAPAFTGASLSDCLVLCPGHLS